MATKIQLRRDTAADWTSNNPTLAAGEFGWESNTNRFKIGDGSTAWTSLSYSDTLKTLGDISVIGSTISAPSNGDLTLTTSGSGVVFVNDTFKIGSGASVTTILDEDNMATDSATVLATQQSIKKYVDDNAGSTGDLSFIGSTIVTPSNADLTLTPGGTGNVVAGAVTINGTTLSAADSSKITIAEALDVTGATTLSGLAYPTSDGDSGQVLQTDGSGTLSWASVSLGDLSIIGATIAAPSNAPLTLISSGSSVNIEGLSVAGNVISTTDSSAGVEITGNLIPSADGVYQLGSSSKRWQTAYLSAETLNIGGATISSDGTGAISIAATGATLPSGSKVGTQNLMLGGKTTGSSGSPVQLVEVFVSDGSTVRSDAQILAQTANLELEFNGTVDDTPVYTEAQQTFTLSTGATLASNQTGVTLFQF